MKILIKNAHITDSGKTFKGQVLIEDEFIAGVYKGKKNNLSADKVIDADGKWLIPGIIDDQVHFREPGLTHKGDIFSESRAAAAGGVTSFMDMPNTIPPTTTISLLEEKLKIAAENSLVNYSFYLGANNSNINEIRQIDKTRVPGVKLFLGSSTGNMLISDENIIEEIFNNSPVICAVHCEDDDIINFNLNKFKALYGDDIPFYLHPAIRTKEACFNSTLKAIEIAKRTNCRLHILHISTADELVLLSNEKLGDKKITAEVCVHHLWFNSDDYSNKKGKIKWNPAIKEEKDRKELLKALKEGKIDIVATDHAPHTLKEKKQNYVNAPSGGPMVQHSLQTMIELMNRDHFSKEELVKYMCHNPADLFKVFRRGYIRESYYADLVLIDLNKKNMVTNEQLLYKCGWSPLEGKVFSSQIATTFVNGKIVFNNGKIIEEKAAMELKYL